MEQVDRAFPSDANPDRVVEDATPNEEVNVEINNALDAARDLKPSRANSLVITKLEEAQMWNARDEQLRTKEQENPING